MPVTKATNEEVKNLSEDTPQSEKKQKKRGPIIIELNDEEVLYEGRYT